MNKKDLSEKDICSKFITPNLSNSGWDTRGFQVREEVTFTDGRVIVQDNSTLEEKKKSRLYSHYKPNLPIAVIEAKDNNHKVGDGMQQALEYSEILDIPLFLHLMEQLCVSR